MSAARTEAATFISFRRLLVKLHKDLFKVGKKYRWNPFPQQLSEFEILVLILEDRRFFLHRGIDCKAIVRETIMSRDPKVCQASV